MMLFRCFRCHHCRIFLLKTPPRSPCNLSTGADIFVKTRSSSEKCPVFPIFFILHHWRPDRNRKRKRRSTGLLFRLSKILSVGADAHIGPLRNATSSPEIARIITFCCRGDVGIAPYNLRFRSFLTRSQKRRSWDLLFLCTYAKMANRMNLTIWAVAWAIMA